MEERFKKLPLRKGVGVILLNKNNQVFVAKRIDNPRDYWQMPQGGVDKNESYIEAAIRELEEETGVKSIKLIEELDGFHTYHLPKDLLGIIWKGKYKGQIQKWYCMRFEGSDDEININTKKPEFLDWKWTEIDKITDHVVDFKLNIYKDIKKKVKKILSSINSRN